MKIKINKKNRKRTQLVKIINIGIFLLLLNFMSCKDSECEYDTGCVPSGVNTERAGFTVATCYAEDPAGDVGVIFNTQMNSLAPRGDDWGNPTTGIAVTAIHPANWKANEIGQVFGIAIDENENIYLATSDVYVNNLFVVIPSTSTTTATIYKCAPPTYNAVVLTTFTSTADAFNDLGNIAYDKVNQQLLVTNLEDGKIYRINVTTGAIIEAYDPWAADVTSPGIVAQDEQIWGIGVNNESGSVKVYFPRVTATSRSMYAITLDSSGAFPAIGSEIVAFTNLPGTQSKITDIAFSSNSNEMLISERGNPHKSITYSYSRSGSTWSNNIQYYVGGFYGPGINGGNAAGGVDFAYKEEDGDISAGCDEFFWASGNFMDVQARGKSYGLQGIEYTGNNPTTATPITTANSATDIFIDFNGTYLTSDKNSIGDVEVFDADRCLECND